MDQRSVSVNSDIPRRFRSRSPIVKRRDRNHSPMSFDRSPYRNSSHRNQSFGGPIDDGYDHRPRQEDLEVISEISAPAHAVVRANFCKEVRGWLVTPISPIESKSIAEAYPIQFEEPDFSIKRPAMDFQVNRRLKIFLKRAVKTVERDGKVLETRSSEIA